MFLHLCDAGCYFKIGNNPASLTTGFVCTADYAEAQTKAIVAIVHSFFEDQGSDLKKIHQEAESYIRTAFN